MVTPNAKTTKRGATAKATSRRTSRKASRQPKNIGEKKDFELQGAPEPHSMDHDGSIEVADAAAGAPQALFESKKSKS